jgi:KaiC/GvpD/RAD55 family RecA-like ATPase
MEPVSTPEALRRMPTGIAGFDEIAAGGLPRHGVTLVLGGVGAGKTIFGMQVLSTGVRERQEAGLLVAFEESAEKIVENTRDFTWGGDAATNERIHILDAQLSQTVERAASSIWSDCSASSPPKRSESARARSSSTVSTCCSATCPTRPTSAGRCSGCVNGCKPAA